MAIGFTHRWPVANLATGIALSPTVARHQCLWKGHKATILPNYFYSPANYYPLIGLSALEATVVGALTHAMGQHGRHIDDHGSGGNYVRFPSISGQPSHMKLTPPMTLNMVFRFPTQTATNKAFLYVTDEKSAIGNYRGLMVWYDASNLWVGTADNTSALFNTGWTTANFGLTTVDAWLHVILVIRDVGSDVDGWVNDGPIAGSVGYTAGQTQSNGTVTHANCGWQRAVAGITTGYVDLHLWQSWNRALSSGEQQLLKVDPLAMLRPVRRVQAKSPIVSRVVTLGATVRRDGRVVLVG